MSRASKILESLSKSSKIHEGYVYSDKLDTEASKTLLSMNGLREVGDTLINVKGVELKDSVILSINRSSIDYAISSNDGVEITVHEEFKGKEYTFKLSKKGAKALKSLL